METGAVMKLWRLLLVTILLLTAAETGLATPLIWTGKSPMPIATSRASSGVVNGSIYVLGGSTATGVTNEVYVYDPAAPTPDGTGTWGLGGYLPEPRLAAAEGTKDGVIYLAGGIGSAVAGQSIVAFDAATGTSRMVGALNTPRARGTGAIVGDMFYVVGGSWSGRVWNSIEAFDVVSHTSAVIAALPEPREQAAVVNLNGKLYIMGGNNASGAPTTTCWVFDPADNSITPRASLPVALSVRNAVTWNGKIYVVGGVTSTGFPPSSWVTDVREYDPATDTWTTIGNFPTSRYGSMVKVVDSVLYVIGGENTLPGQTASRLAVNEAAVLGTGTDWQTKAPMPVAVHRAASGVAGGRIYVLGGVGNYNPLTGTYITDAVQQYDPTSDSWQLMPPLCFPMFGTGGVSDGGPIVYLPGGFDPYMNFLNTILAYNTTDGTCQQIGSLITPRSRVSGAIVGNKLYVVGGSAPNVAGIEDTIEEVDLATGVSTIKTSMFEPRAVAGVVAVNGKIYIIGGYDGSNVTGSCWEYDPVANVITAKQPMVQPMEVRKALHVNGRIYAVSVFPLADGYNLVQEYDIAADSWKIAARVPTSADVPSAEIVNGMLHVLGGLNANGALNRNEALKVADAVDTLPPATTVLVSGLGGKNGYFVSDVRLDFTVQDNPGGSGVARTEFSYDAVTWEVMSGLTMTLTTEGFTLLYFRSVDNAGNVESINAVGVQIDKTPAATAPAINGAVGRNGWYFSDVQVTLSAADSPGGSGVERIEYSLDNTSWVSYAGSLTFGEGIHSLYYRSFDNAGNCEPIGSVTVNIDKTLPVTTLSLQGPEGLNGWYTGGVTVSFSASDNLAGVDYTAYFLDGNPLKFYAAPFQITKQGTSVLHYFSEDKVGMQDHHHVGLKIDSEAPVVNHALLGTTGANGWYTSDVTVTLVASDTGSGIAAAEFSLDGVNWTIYTAPFVIATEGATTIMCRARDLAGNKSAVQSFSIKIDKGKAVASAAALGTLGENGIYVSNVQVSMAGSDAVSGLSRIEYSTDGATWSTYTAPLTITKEGMTTVYYRAVDVAGNVETPIGRLSFTVDKTAPVVATMDPFDNALDVPLDRKINIAFSETVTAGPSYGDIALKRGKRGNTGKFDAPSTSTINGSVLSIMAVEGLVKNSTYTVTVPAGAVKDHAGHELPTQFVFTFTTVKH